MELSKSLLVSIEMWDLIDQAFYAYFVDGMKSGGVESRRPSFFQINQSRYFCVRLAVVGRRRLVGSRIGFKSERRVGQRRLDSFLKDYVLWDPVGKFENRPQGDWLAQVLKGQS